MVLRLSDRWLVCRQSWKSGNTLQLQHGDPAKSCGFQRCLCHKVFYYPYILCVKEWTFNGHAWRNRYTWYYCHTLVIYKHCKSNMSFTCSGPHQYESRQAFPYATLVLCSRRQRWYVVDMVPFLDNVNNTITWQTNILIHCFIPTFTFIYHFISTFTKMNIYMHLIKARVWHKAQNSIHTSSHPRWQLFSIYCFPPCPEHLEDIDVYSDCAGEFYMYTLQTCYKRSER